MRFDPQAWEDHLCRLATDHNIQGRLNVPIEQCTRTPFAGTEKPESLRGKLSGWWSRRLTVEHRLVYRVADDTLPIAQCQGHYCVSVLVKRLFSSRAHCLQPST